MSLLCQVTELSPPAWGWSELCAIKACTCWVVPTRVGMVRDTGDGSGATRALSPPAWGWSGDRADRDEPRIVVPTRVGMVRIRHRRRHHDDVVPTRVGMVRCGNCPLLSRDRCPHPRGDGPHAIAQQNVATAALSPPAWGWSALGRQAEDIKRVVPTREVKRGRRDAKLPIPAIDGTA